MPCREGAGLSPSYKLLLVHAGAGCPLVCAGALDQAAQRTLAGRAFQKVHHAAVGVVHRRANLQALLGGQAGELGARL